MTSFQQQQTRGPSQQHRKADTTTSYEIINNFCLSEPEPIDLKSKLKRNYTVIIYLAILTLVSFGAVFTFSSLIKRFHNSHCFLDTPFKFNAHRGSPEVLSDNETTINNTTTTTASTFSASLSSIQIDREETMWSKHERCDSVTYPPVIMGMSAIIWMTMFYLCSMTDRNHKSLIPNPWRIVLPAFVYFVCMSILSIYYAVHSLQSINGACQSLASAFDRNGSIPSCARLFDQFAVGSARHYVNASVLYYAFYVCTYSVMILWIFLSALMLFRCLLGVDFVRTDVEIKPISVLSVSQAPTPPLLMARESGVGK